MRSHTGSPITTEATARSDTTPNRHAPPPGGPGNTWDPRSQWVNPYNVAAREGGGLRVRGRRVYGLVAVFNASDNSWLNLPTSVWTWAGFTPCASSCWETRSSALSRVRVQLGCQGGRDVFYAAVCPVWPARPHAPQQSLRAADWQVVLDVPEKPDC